MFKSPSILSTLFCVLFSSAVFAEDGCYICSPSESDDGIQRCKYHNSDTEKQRENCKEAGCEVIWALSSCPNDSEMKVIDPNR